MVSKIKFKVKGKEYVLEYTRNSIVEMERRGFNAFKIPEMTFTLLPDLFAGAFVANHPDAPRDFIDEIYEQFDDKGELLGALAEMYTAAIEAYIAELKKARNGLEWEKI